MSLFWGCNCQKLAILAAINIHGHAENWYQLSLYIISFFYLFSSHLTPPILHQGFPSPSRNPIVFVEIFSCYDILIMCNHIMPDNWPIVNYVQPSQLSCTDTNGSKWRISQMSNAVKVRTHSLTDNEKWFDRLLSIKVQRFSNIDQ